MRIHLPQLDSLPSPFIAQHSVLLHLKHPFDEDPILSHDWDSSACTLGSSRPSSPSPISSPPGSPSSSDTSTSELDESTCCLDSDQDYLTHTQPTDAMPKRRTSLQSILIPPFLAYPLSSSSSEPSRTSAHGRSPSTSTLTHTAISLSSSQSAEAASLKSSRSSPPPDFLLDDDPFANHTGARPLPLYRNSPTSPTHSRRASVKQPRSPLATDLSPATPLTRPSSPPVPIQCSRSTSSASRISPPLQPVGGRQLRPAYTRPAFAQRPSLPSLHTLAQSDFVYSIKARKGTLGARLPLEPWDVSAAQETVSEEAPTPSFHGLAHATDHVHISDSELGPEQFIGGNEDNHTGDSRAHSTDACNHALDSEASFLQTPISLDPSPEESPQMFASLLDVLSTLSSGSLSRSPSTSSSSSSSMPVLSPDHQTLWGGDSPSRSPNRSSSEESVPADFSFDDDILHLPSKAFELDDGHFGSIDFLSMPGTFSMVDSFQPGTSVGTIRPPINSFASDSISTPSDEDWPPTYDDYATPELHEADIFDQNREDDETIDGHDYEYRTTRKDEDFERHQSSNGHGNNSEGWRYGNTSGSNGNEWGSSGRRGGGRDDRRKDDRHWRAPSAFSTPSDTESDESEKEGTRQSHSGASGDDDVPLAQSIPTALRAQRTIQKQVREEKDERRRRRALRRQQQQRQATHNQTSPTELSRHHTQVGPTSLQGPSQPIPSSHTTRPRTRTLPSNTSRPVVAEDLARRLKNVQDLNSLPMSSLNRHRHSPSDAPSHSEQLGYPPGDHSRSPNIAVPDKPIRPMRSFHRPSHADNTREQPVPVPSLAHDTHRLGRSATTSSHRVRQHDQREISARATPGSRSKSTRRPQTSDGAQQPTVAPLTTSVFQHVTAPRTPADTLDSSPLTPSVPREIRQISWQQRVFIVDLQRFNTLMMTPTTTAKDVIDTLEAQGQLANWVGVGGWMLFEVSQDFGMERPIRHFEAVSDVINSWDKNKSVNLLVVKKTPLATLLHPSAMPSSSPVLSTYVEWESKPRKWSKRWLELREQGLWLSKKDNGKDETFLCSLANFDAYMVTRIHKSPKPYVFAVKSTDSLSFFENSADYVHVFCCSEKDGQKWLESVLLARSYFINQERNTLSVGTNSGSGGPLGKSLSRSRTHKGSRSAPQPLVNVSATAAAANPPQGYAFEPGSLLAKR